MRPLAIPFLVLALAGTASAQARDPRIGYLFPAGAQAGTTVEVTAGGQNLRAIQDAHVSVPGVKVTVLNSYRAIRNLNGSQRRELQWRIQSRRAVLAGRQPPPPPPALVALRAEENPNPDQPPPPIRLPAHPLVDRLDQLDQRELEHLLITHLPTNRRQLNPQLGELLTLRVEVAPDAPPGPCELRLLGPAGATNPLAFHLGATPEVRESEPNDPGSRVPLLPPATPPPPPDPPAAPFTLNGQILPGDVDHFTFTARRGQQLVVRAHARDLIPYLADAVPGWFQMVIEVRDADGTQVAWADDFHFSPDPVLAFTAPRDCPYELVIRDSIHRGREDFVYRIEVGELPFVSSVFPLGATQDSQTTTRLAGWNLPTDSLQPDTSPADHPIRHLTLPGTPFPSNSFAFHVDELPARAEAEPNDSGAAAGALALPCIVDGRIAAPGDADTFRIDGGGQLVAEVIARRLGSPLDALLRLTDASGQVIAWADDRMDKDGHLHLGPGLLTHHADCSLHATLAGDGPWFITIADAQGHGSDAHAYRLRLSPPRPDFELRVTPSTVNLRPGGSTPIEVFALRHDGFNGPIQLTLAGDPRGLRLSGARIPPGRHRIRCTLTAPPTTPPGPLQLTLRGRALTADRTLDHPATPADDMMQAFLWRHLAPARLWLACVGPPKTRRPPVTIAGKLPVRIPAGGSADVTLKIPKWLVDRDLQLTPSDPPDGLAVSPPHPAPAGVTLTLTADPAKLPQGSADNLLLEASTATPAKNPTAPPARTPPRTPAGFLPAIPFVVTAP